MIEINEKSYIVKVWFSGSNDKNHNWLAIIMRDPENPENYKGSPRFSNHGEKSWSSFEANQEQMEELIVKLDILQQAMQIDYPYMDTIIANCHGAKFAQKLKNKEWAKIFASH